MRLNQYIAACTSLSRRVADQVIADGQVTVNSEVAKMGMQISANDAVSLDGRTLVRHATQTIILNKPVGYICSRRVQGNSPTIYKLLPTELSHLKAVGRLDKDSSGLLIMTTDGQLAQRLSHPSSNKWKAYQVKLNKRLMPVDFEKLSSGVMLEDGLSLMQLNYRTGYIEVQLQEGRNRQIRRSFASVGYTVTYLHRTSISSLQLGGLTAGKWRQLTVSELGI